LNNTHKLEGLVIPCITPFTDDLSEVDFEKFDKLVDYLIEEQCADAIIPIGTTGESTSLSHLEKELVIERAVKRANKRVPIFIGAGGANLAETISLSEYAENIGADGLLIVVPYYIRPDQEGIYQFFKAVAQRTNLPIMIYNIPSRTAVNMSIDTIMKIANIDNVIGIKDCFNDITNTSEMIRICRNELKKEFSILTGEDTNIFINLCLGGNGAVAATGHVVGKKIKEMINKYKAGDIKGARGIQFDICTLQKYMFKAPNPAPIKAALDILGLNLGGKVRLPLVDINDDFKKLIKSELCKFYDF